MSINHDALFHAISVLKEMIRTETTHWLHLDNMRRSKTVQMCDRIEIDLEVLQHLLDSKHYTACCATAVENSVNIANLKKCFHMKAQGGKEEMEKRKKAAIAQYNHMVQLFIQLVDELK